MADALERFCEQLCGERWHHNRFRVMLLASWRGHLDGELLCEAMNLTHLVRVGAMGHVGRFRAADAGRYARGQRVVLRTARGLEIGRVMTPEGGAPGGEPDGDLLRRMTVQDDLLAERLERNREAAYASCVGLLEERGSAAVLLDVEHLFDGRGLYFYFLGDTDPISEAISAELAEAYDAEARFGDFAKTVEEGCGPGCGDRRGGQRLRRLGRLLDLRGRQRLRGEGAPRLSPLRQTLAVVPPGR